MGDVARLGVVVGLPSEAIHLRRVLWQAPPPVFCSGADPSRVASGVAGLVTAGAQDLLSFGLAGGLAPFLKAGDIVLADRVISPSGREFPTDDDVRRRIAVGLDHARVHWHSGAIAGVTEIIATTEAKRQLANATGAIAVDMESHEVASAAAECTFAALRVIVDPAQRTIPSCVLTALKPDGGIRRLALLKALIVRPRELGSVLALARDNLRANAGLRRAAAAIGEAFDLL